MPVWLQPWLQQLLVSPVAPPSRAGLAWWLVYLFFFGAGFLLSLAAMYFAIRDRQDKYALVKGAGGGLIGSGIFAALGARIGGLQAVTLTWLEAGILGGLGFIFGFIVWLVLAAILFEVFGFRPIQKRYGASYAAQMRMGFLSGHVELRKLLRVSVDQKQTDEAWDEFALAVYQMPDPETVSIIRLVNGMQRFIGTEEDRKAAGQEPILKALQHVFEGPLQTFSAQMNLTRLNFSLWRIAADGPLLEHLASFPYRVQHQHKEALPIWADKERTHTATLAGEVLHVGEFRTMRSEEILGTKYIARGLGTNYDEIACMPIPCDGGEVPPWGVLCLENRGGLIPLRSESVKLLMATLGRGISLCEPILRVRDLEQVRTGPL